MRDGEWYYKAYKFLEQFDGLELHWGMWLDGVYERYCIKDTKTGEWLGPEVEQPVNKTLAKKIQINQFFFIFTLLV